MLQRSPTYVVSRPAEDKMANWLRRWMSSKLAYSLVRWRNVLFGMYFFNRARKKPEQTKTGILKLAQQQLPEGYDLSHFTPRYNPWDQRLCLIPDADLFRSISEGRASVVTDEIETFTETGVRLVSGRELPADLIVTATGLDLLFIGGAKIIVDGREIEMSAQFAYKGMMYSGVPNFASVFGYTNASWTLKADLTCRYVCRLINHMDANGLASVTPQLRDSDVAPEPWLDFSSGYVQRSISKFPKQGSKAPWKLNQNYLLDLRDLRGASLDDGVLTFAKAGSEAKQLA
jgi:cation diffusion facilitator CzcD-associated flavoprotein CzcO